MTKLNAQYLETAKLHEIIIESLPYGILVLDGEGTVLFCNNQAHIYLQLKQNKTIMIGLHFANFLNQLPLVRNMIEARLKKSNKTFDLVNVAFLKSYLTIRARPFNDGMILTIDDVTKAKVVERTNLNVMLKGQEQERKRLAREIHDGLGPVLSTIKLHLDALRTQLRSLPDKVIDKIQVMEELIQEASDDIRAISHALMPSALLDLGLVVALDNLCQKANKSEKVKVNFYHSGIEERIDQLIALGIFRMAQELLNNAFKHAQAKTINVQLIRYPQSLLLMVEDDGIGFDKAKSNQLSNHGIGLRNVHTRAKALRGNFNIDTQLGRGVVATVEIPFNE